MAAIEPACFVIAALWLALRLAVERDRRALVQRLLIVAMASWAGEESCIRLYGFYTYASHWQARVLDVPLAVVCIWPIVVQSALDLTRAVPAPKRALVAAGLVTVDASLIEPISTRIGLWTWFEAGPFSVPVVGVLGWGFFALGVALVIERRPWWALLVGPVITHLCLQATWWGAARWLPAGEGELPFVALAALGSCAVAALLWRRPPPVAARDVWLRAPAAGFFFALLALFARDDGWLVAWALAFAPPWLVLLARRPPAAKPVIEAQGSGHLLALACAAAVGVGVLVGALVHNRDVDIGEPSGDAVAIDEPVGDDERTLVLVGDVMLARGVAARAEREGAPFLWFFEPTRALIAGADVAFANLESPISGRGQRSLNPIAFNAPPAAAAGLAEAGFDVVSLANNHALDYGPVALDDTRALLAERGVRALGVGRFDEPQAPVIVDARGVTVGFLGYCDPRGRGSCPFVDGALVDKPYRALRRTVERDVRALRARVDVVVVSLHWGVERRHAPSARQVALARHLVDLGVDVVAGHHPHVQQPAERYGRGLILYSMGNFVFDQRTDPAYTQSRLYRVVVGKGGVRRAAWLPLEERVRQWQPHPTAASLRAVTTAPSGPSAPAAPSPSSPASAPAAPPPP